MLYGVSWPLREEEGMFVFWGHVSQAPREEEDNVCVSCMGFRAQRDGEDQVLCLFQRSCRSDAMAPKLKAGELPAACRKLLKAAGVDQKNITGSLIGQVPCDKRKQSRDLCSRLILFSFYCFSWFRFEFGVFFCLTGVV